MKPFTKPVIGGKFLSLICKAESKRRRPFIRTGEGISKQLWLKCLEELAWHLVISQTVYRDRLRPETVLLVSFKCPWLMKPLIVHVKGTTNACCCLHLAGRLTESIGHSSVSAQQAQNLIEGYLVNVQLKWLPWRKERTDSSERPFFLSSALNGIYSLLPSTQSIAQPQAWSDHQAPGTVLGTEGVKN